MSCKVSAHRYSNGNARRKLRARIKAEGRPCALCGKPIDYSLPARHPMSYELDEIIPFSKGGDPLSYENVQPAHRQCNLLKSNKIYKSSAQECKSDKRAARAQALTEW